MFIIIINLCKVLLLIIIINLLLLFTMWVHEKENASFILHILHILCLQLFNLLLITHIG